MKKVKFVIPALILIAVGIFMLTRQSGQTIQPGIVLSTDLRGVTIQGMRIDDEFANFDLSGLTFINSSEHGWGPNYYYDTMCVSVGGNGYIIEIKGYSNAVYSVNGVSELATPDDVIAVLGSNYHEYWFDREQQLRAITYTDAANTIYLTCVYNHTDRELVWLILSKYKNLGGNLC